MKQCAVLLATVGLLTGCAHNQTTTAKHHRSLDTASGGARSQFTSTSETGRTMQSGSTVSDQSVTTTSSNDRMIEIPLYREELRVGKREVSKGGVVIRKVVETERASQPVELQREEVVIERLTADQARARGATDTQPFSEKEMVIELTREVPNVEKRAFVTEVIRARKTTDTQRQTIADTVRRENINIDRQALQADASQTTRADRDVGAAAAAETGRTSQTARTESDRGELYLHEEQLDVSKRRIPSGRVVLRKTVETERVSQPVELRTEDVQIDRDTARRAAGDTTAQAFTSREIYIPLTEEIPVIQKDVRVAEVVRARTNVETDRETINAQVRRERAEIVRNDADRRTTTDATTRSNPDAQGGQAATEQGRSEFNREQTTSRTFEQQQNRQNLNSGAPGAQQNSNSQTNQ